MRETTVSNCERIFFLKAILEGKRLDGRKDNDSRNLDIVFGSTWGHCLVSLGETRVMAQTTYEVQTPKSTRPNEGLLHVNVDYSPMAAQSIEPGRPPEASVQLNRLLEKCLKESKCLDLESLCIVAEEKVWAVRVDVTALNHDGGLVDCASIAALASLAHSRRPDVTLSGEKVTIHSFADRDPLSLTLHHYPICVSYAIFDKGSKAVVDPTAAEEEAAETRLVVGMNAFRELCGLHLDGTGLPSNDDNDIILQCVSRAGARAIEIINTLKQTLAEDEKRRSQKESIGLSEFVRLNKMSSLSEDKIPIRLNSGVLQKAVNKVMYKHRNKKKVWDDDGNEIEVPADSDNEEEVVSLGNNTAKLVNRKSRNNWRLHIKVGAMPQLGRVIDGEEEEDDDEEEEEDLEEEEPQAKEVNEKEEPRIKKPIKTAPPEMEISDSDDDVQEITSPGNLVKKNNVKQAGPSKSISRKDVKANSKENKFKEVEPMSDDSEEIQVVQELTYEDKMRLAEKIVLDDSEEEETLVLPGNGEASKPQPTSQTAEIEKPVKGKEKDGTPNQKKNKKKNKNKNARTWYPKGKW